VRTAGDDRWSGGALSLLQRGRRRIPAARALLAPLVVALLFAPAASAAPSGKLVSGTAARLGPQPGPRPVPPPKKRTRLLGPSAAPAAPSAAIGGPWTLLGPRPISTEYLGGDFADQNVGKVSGRVTSLAASPANGSVIYAGTVDGGVWKSTNGGGTWAPMSDHEASLSIGALALGDSTGQVVYAGTGEANRSTSQYGQGILKSTNGGQTWTLLGQSTFAGHHISSMAVDSTTSGSTQRVFAATDKGLFVSQDGGATWTQNTNILDATTPWQGATPSGGVTEIIQDPSTSTKFWAAISDSCGTEAGNIAVSTNSGANWTDVNHFPALPQATRLGLGVGTSGVAYTAFADCDGNLRDIEKTANGGSMWSSLASSPGYTDYLQSSTGQGDYDNVVGVDPANSAHAVFGGVSMLATSDGGQNFHQVSQPAGCGQALSCPAHVDFHAVAFTGLNSFYAGNDGGAWKTTDLGGTGTRSDWTDLNATLAITEFYHGTAHTLAHPLGGAQDNGSSGNFPGDAALPTWFSYYGADGGFTAIDPTAGSSTAYAESQYLGIAKLDTSTAEFTHATPCDSYGMDANGNELCKHDAVSDHVGFIAPFVMDPTNPQRLLAGTVSVYETTNGGVGSSSWHSISGDLTLGGTDTLSMIVIGPPGATSTIYTGSELGAVYQSTNGGASWTNVTGNLPTYDASHYLYPNPVVSGITFNPSNPSEAWVTNGEIGVGHVWHTTNAGAPGGTTWTDLSGGGASGLPDAPALAALIDPDDPGTVYVGTYYGARVCTTCGGANPSPSWEQLGSGLPNAAVAWLSLTADNSSIVAWTKGRGAWSMPRPLAQVGGSNGAPGIRAVGDFNNDGFKDLAIGSPGEDVGSTVDAGVLNVLSGSASGLTSTGAKLFNQSQAGGATEVGDRFGAALG
jgi:hypothetical protein